MNKTWWDWVCDIGALFFVAFLLILPVGGVWLLCSTTPYTPSKCAGVIENKTEYQTTAAHGLLIPRYQTVTHYAFLINVTSGERTGDKLWVLVPVKEYVNCQIGELYNFTVDDISQTLN